MRKVYLIDNALSTLIIKRKSRPARTIAYKKHCNRHENRSGDGKYGLPGREIGNIVHAYQRIDTGIMNFFGHLATI